jgi:hypothetical protein
MFKNLSLILILIACFAVVRAPASLVEHLFVLPPSSSIQVNRISGTIWSGSASIKFNQLFNADLDWSIPFQKVLVFKPAVIWSLKSNLSSLKGKSLIASDRITTKMSGEVDAYLLNILFDLSGNLDVRSLRVKNELNKEFSLSSLEGELEWSGGPVSYILSTFPLTIDSPAFQINVRDQQAYEFLAELYAENTDYPLLTIELEKSGFAKIKVTKNFTQLFGNVWPGAQADKEIVFELEEKIF